MKTRTIINLLLIAACTNAAYATDFVTFKRHSLSDIELTRTSDTITYDPLDWKGVKMAVENLRHLPLPPEATRQPRSPTMQT